MSCTSSVRYRTCYLHCVPLLKSPFRAPPNRLRRRIAVYTAQQISDPAGQHQSLSAKLPIFDPNCAGHTALPNNFDPPVTPHDRSLRAQIGVWFKTFAQFSTDFGVVSAGERTCRRLGIPMPAVPIRIPAPAKPSATRLTTSDLTLATRV
jgi:hypothetical protein